METLQGLSIFGFKWYICFRHVPTMLFSGAGGTIIPRAWCFSTSFSWSPRKSLNRR